MHAADPTSPLPTPSNGQPWWRELTRYHWFVFVVAALGWLFDTMDQQLFNLARVPAMKELLRSEDGKAPSKELVAEYAGYSTSIFLIGWAIGGLTFGVLGDRIGRAKTMLLTILVYSIFTGLSALSVGFWDFSIYRFLTGLGVGGEFAVGVALVAEVMPARARPHALGLLQALSAIGNITAALISILLGHLEESGAIGSAWRIMFVIGTAPALLAVLIRRRLKEPERWRQVATGAELEAQAAASASNAPPAPRQQLGSMRELFADPRWRKNAIVGLLLASAGVIGLWGIGFFAIDLNRSVFRKTFTEEARVDGQAEYDRRFVIQAIAEPKLIAELQEKEKTRVEADDLINLRANSKDAQPAFTAVLALIKDKQSVSVEAVLTKLEADDKTKAVAKSLRETRYLEADDANEVKLKDRVEAIRDRTRKISGRLTLWAGLTSMMLNIGAFFGIYMFGSISQRVGRRPTFAVCFVLALLSTAMVFMYLNELSQVFWMIPIMGFCQLSLFGGYAIYFPELFPTRLRSTGISFCYNVGRLAAAVGPAALGLLTGVVFKDYPEPMRYAGLTMCGIFLLGLVALPFAPETKGKPLPE